MTDIEINELIRAFKPKFGDDRSIRIAKMVVRRTTLKNAIANHAKNVTRLSRAVENKTAKEKELEEVEKTIRWELEQAKPIV